MRQAILATTKAKYKSNATVDIDPEWPFRARDIVEQQPGAPETCV